jgi:Rad3-related DNA helicase
VAPALREYLWDRFETVIATSATLTTGGTFDFWLERVGAPADTRTLQLSSPFDFQRQARLFLPCPAAAFEPRYPGRQGYDAYADLMTTTLIDLIRRRTGEH